MVLRATVTTGNTRVLKADMLSSYPSRSGMVPLKPTQSIITEYAVNKFVDTLSSLLPVMMSVNASFSVNVGASVNVNVCTQCYYKCYCQCQ